MKYSGEIEIRDKLGCQWIYIQESQAIRFTLDGEYAFHAVINGDLSMFCIGCVCTAEPLC